MVLTDEEIETVRNAALLSFRRHQSSVRGQQITQCDDPEYHLICAIESAVLEKLKAQEPVAKIVVTTSSRYKKGTVNVTSYCDIETEFKPHETVISEKFLYEHPLPPDDVVRDPRVAELEATCVDHGEIQKALCDRVAELEAVLRECREALVKNIVGTGGRTPAAHEAIAKIDEVLK